ncbi:MAG: ATP phosphoribosyltransferase regulatory subunit [Clostridia bacterium]|nr:ATP phosphoribosyltransferase regulatory subunit [Clostridia bacterium]
MKYDNSPVRGTKDYLPTEMSIRERVREIILKTYKSFGFMQIGTPILEDINKLLGSDGGDNLKLIFKILKRGEKLDLSKPNLKESDIVDIGLRYDQTVPLARMYANNQNELPSPFKAIQIGYSFRADRPQHGRTRQLMQCDIDILGDSSVNAEIDILNTTAKTFYALGFRKFVVKVNDRRILSDLIAVAGFKPEEEKEVCISLDKLDKIGVDGVKAELSEKGYSKSAIEKLMKCVADIQNNPTKALPMLADLGVRAEVVNELKTVLDSVNKLATRGFKAVFDISIVRGQNYYTGLVYEFYLEGMGGACAGGGRYDNMVEKLVGKSVPAVGLGLGFEPTCLAVIEQNLLKAAEKTVAVMYRENDDFVTVLGMVEELNKTCNASAIMMKKNVNYQLELLRNNGFTHFCNFPDKKLKSL